MSLTLMDGNEAVAWAAYDAGCRFFAGYPITPATTIFQTMLRLLPPAGGIVLQGEDEIASLGYCLGASAAGHKAMTATSGPGMSLFSEQISFALAAEIPVVIVDVQRLGPSTGYATKGADGDIQFLRWGNSGGLGPIALAPTDVGDSYTLTVHAFNLAERFRTPVVVASSKEIGMTRESIDFASLERPPLIERSQPSSATDCSGSQNNSRIAPLKNPPCEAAYTDGGSSKGEMVSPFEPMRSGALSTTCTEAKPRQAGQTASDAFPSSRAKFRELPYAPFRPAPGGDVPLFAPIGGRIISRITSSMHGEDGYITSDAEETAAQVERLHRKTRTRVDEFTFYEADTQAGAETLVVSYGVTARAVRQAVRELRDLGARVSALTLKTLWPVPERLLREVATGHERVLVIEANTGQYVREVERVLPNTRVDFLGRMDGDLIPPDRIKEAVVGS